MTKKALITGITGQDGSYLADLLVKKGYEVHGIIRRSSSFNTGRIIHIFEEVQNVAAQVKLHYGDLTDGSTLARYLRTIKPDEIYNLGAQSHVRTSFDIPEYTANVVALGTIRLLEAIREAELETKFYQASSSEMFGNEPAPQDENTPMKPVSPYAIAKLFSHLAVQNYRESYGLFAVSGILFNHESPRRGETFVTRKITRRLAQILKGTAKKLYLGNLEAKRDWGYAPEFVEAIWLMMQQEKPDDYVIATGKVASVKDFLDYTFSSVGLNWQDYVEIDQRYFRPSEVDELRGNPEKAKKHLGWEPKVTVKELAQIMVKADLKNEGLNPEEYIKN